MGKGDGYCIMCGHKNTYRLIRLYNKVGKARGLKEKIEFIIGESLVEDSSFCLCRKHLNSIETLWNSVSTSINCKMNQNLPCPFFSGTCYRARPEMGRQKTSEDKRGCLLCNSSERLCLLYSKAGKANGLKFKLEYLLGTELRLDASLAICYNHSRRLRHLWKEVTMFCICNDFVTHQPTYLMVKG